MLEFAHIRVKFTTSRTVLAELSRHRLISLAVQSQRYVDYSDGVTFIIPVWCKQMEEGEVRGIDEYFYHSYNHLSSEEQTFLLELNKLESSYKNWINRGWTPQQAREVLPGCTGTEIIMSCNFRELRHILKLRTNKAAHPQMRALMTGLLEEAREKIPLLFDKI